MTQFTCWAMDRKTESFHYTHCSRDTLVVIIVLPVYALLMSLIYGVMDAELLIFMGIVLLILVGCGLSARSHAVFDREGIHFKNRKRQELAMIPWSRVKGIEAHPALKNADMVQMRIFTVHPIAVNYLLEKKGTFQKANSGKYMLDRTMEQLAWSRESPEAATNQQLYTLSLSEAGYQKIYGFWKSALQGQLEEPPDVLQAK